MQAGPDGGGGEAGGVGEDLLGDAGLRVRGQAGEGGGCGKWGEGFRCRPGERAAEAAVAVDEGVGVERVHRLGGEGAGEADEDAAGLDVGGGGGDLGCGERDVGEKNDAGFGGEEALERAGDEGGPGGQRAA